MEDLDVETNRRDITTLLKDGMMEVIMIEGKDGKMVPSLQLKNKSAWYKTLNINSHQFGMMAEYLETFAMFANTVKYHMSKPMADVLSLQIKEFAEILRYSIDAKSSETMRNKRNAQTSMIDKYLENKQEKVIDLKGEMKRTFGDMLMGKESEKATN